MEHHRENEMETLGPFKGVCGNMSYNMVYVGNTEDHMQAVLPIMESQMEKKLEHRSRVLVYIYIYTYMYVIPVYACMYVCMYVCMYT